MERTIDLTKSIHDICREYPDVAEIMRELGFSDITKLGMLNTAGRFMTIPKGAAMKGIGIDQIKAAFENKGFKLQGQ